MILVIFEEIKKNIHQPAILGFNPSARVLSLIAILVPPTKKGWRNIRDSFHGKKQHV